MKSPRSLIVSVAATLLCSSALCASLPPNLVPEFPLDDSGRIDIAGGGTSGLTQEEMLPVVMEWIYSHMDNGNVEENPDGGVVTATGTFLVAEDELYEGTRSVEFMEYTVVVSCSDNAFSYRIGDVDVYVTTVLWPAGFVPYKDMPYDIIEISSIEMPGDYMMLIENSAGQRAALRERLEKLLAQDMDSVNKGKRRRYERELEQTAQWYAAVDDYYRNVRENYMACYDCLTSAASSLEAAMGGTAVEEILTPEI